MGLNPDTNNIPTDILGDVSEKHVQNLTSENEYSVGGSLIIISHLATIVGQLKQ